MNGTELLSAKTYCDRLTRGRKSDWRLRHPGKFNP